MTAHGALKMSPGQTGKDARQRSDKKDGRMMMMMTMTMTMMMVVMV